MYPDLLETDNDTNLSLPAANIHSNNITIYLLYLLFFIFYLFLTPEVVHTWVPVPNLANWGGMCQEGHPV